MKHSPAPMLLSHPLAALTLLAACSPSPTQPPADAPPAIFSAATANGHPHASPDRDSRETHAPACQSQN
jgi:hypothetical protein